MYLHPHAVQRGYVESGNSNILLQATMNMSSNLPRELDGAGIDAAPATDLDVVDKCILNRIQSGFPLETRPYAVIGHEAGVSEREAFERVQRLKERGLIRRIGANFQSSKLGFHSTLCAAKVPLPQLDAFIAEVNARPGVTHNYLRDHEYNVWFTCIGPSPANVQATLDAISAATGITVLNLPAERLYKIKVDFQMA